MSSPLPRPGCGAWTTPRSATAACGECRCSIDVGVFTHPQVGQSCPARCLARGAAPGPHLAARQLLARRPRLLPGPRHLESAIGHSHWSIIWKGTIITPPAIHLVGKRGAQVSEVVSLLRCADPVELHRWERPSSQANCLRHPGSQNNPTSPGHTVPGGLQRLPGRLSLWRVHGVQRCKSCESRP